VRALRITVHTILHLAITRGTCLSAGRSRPELRFTQPGVAELEGRSCSEPDRAQVVL
jgi:hypothetical protein